MDRHQLHHRWRQLRRLRPEYLLAVTAISGVSCVIGLRHNNLVMAQLRDNVYAADRQNGNVVGALQQLQVYVTTHMNTDLASGPNSPYPPVQLQYTYDRAVQAAGSTASAANAKVYTDAQAYCEQQDPYDFSGRNRVPCVQQYILSHGAALPNIPDSLYKFDFLSPSWSPDLAGWSLLVAASSFVISVVGWGYRRWLRQQVR